MDCNYEKCPAKIHLETVNKRLDVGNNEFEQMRKDSRELNRRITEIATHQTKISSDLLIHMNRSEDKHNQLVNLISSLGRNLENHTNDEMKLQTNLIEKLEKIEKKQDTDHAKVNLLWGGVGVGAVAVIALGWDLVRKYVFGL